MGNILAYFNGSLEIRHITYAHQRTCQYSPAQISDMFHRPQNIDAVLHYKNMGYGDLWLEVANRLTAVIQRIIQFAKMLPGFMQLPMNDKIILLKTGAFDVAVLRVSRQFDPETNSVIFGEAVLPLEAFFTDNSNEMKLVTSIFDIARAIAELNLNETQLALYSAYVLLSSVRPGLRRTAEISYLNSDVFGWLRSELAKTNRDETVLAALLAQLPELREINLLHLKVLENLHQQAPQLVFPRLHSEVFS